jgi:hypothetical protein
MLWLSWRQHRTELLITLALGLSLAGAMTVVTYQANSGFGAVRQACPWPLCVPTLLNFDSQFSTLFTLFEGALLGLPGLAGIFMGAPLLAREFEQGTVRLVWTQGVTRHRWLATKIGVILAGCVLMGGLLAAVGSLMTGTPEGMFTSRWSSFDLQGPALVSYVIFGVALGTTAGALIRRVVASMAVTGVIFAAVRVGVAQLLRPNFLPPLSIDQGQVGPGPGDSWNLGIRAVDLSGHPVSQDYFNQLMANAGDLPGSVSDYLRAHGVVELYIYQPESRFWVFQSIEALLFISLAAALVGVVLWSTRRA